MKRISEKNIRWFQSVGSAILVLIILFLVVTRLLGFIAPFLIALIITSLIERPVGFFQKRLKLPRGLAVAGVMILFVVASGTLISLVFYRLLLEVWNLTKDSPNLHNIIFHLRRLFEHTEAWYINLPDEIVNNIQANIDNVLDGIGNTLIRSIDGLLKLMLGILQSLPQVFLYIIISLVSAFFMSRDRERISRFVFGQLPPVWREKIRSIKRDLLQAMAGYVKAQMMLISITFVQVLIGYSIAGVGYAFFLAIVTAIFDLLPILGPGTILIPGAILYFVAGNTGIAIGYIILYISVLIVRQFLEPRIVGGNIGIHPLVTLIFIYLGFRIFGIFGIILGPIFAIIIKALQKAEVLPQWKQT